MTFEGPDTDPRDDDPRDYCSNPALDRDRMAIVLACLALSFPKRPLEDRTNEQALVVLEAVRDALLEQPVAPLADDALSALHGAVLMLRQAAP